MPRIQWKSLLRPRLTRGVVVAGSAVAIALAGMIAIGQPDGPQTQPASGFRIGKIKAKGIVESSGLAASRTQPGVFWTHNDSGSPAELFAIDAGGKLLGTFDVATRNIDWEDIAIVGQSIFIADTGNNRRDRREVFVHSVSEPDLTKGKTSGPLPVNFTWTLTFPNDKPFDVECLVISDSKGYVVSKLRNLSEAGLYRFQLDPVRSRQMLEAVGVLPIRIPVTAGDISADGRWLGITTVNGPYLFRIDGNVESAVKADAKHATFTSPKMEACAFTAEGLLTTTEDGDLLMFRWKDFGVTEP